VPAELDAPAVPRLPVEPVRPGDPAIRPPTTPARSALARGGIPLGRPFGIPVRVSVAGVAIAIALAGLSLGGSAYDAGFTTGQSLALSVTGGLLLELCVLGHEIAHCVAARRLGLRVAGLRLWALGGVTEVEAELRSPAREYAIAVVGPLASIGIGAVAAVVALSIGDTRTDAAGLLFAWLASINALLAAGNLLPGLPLDGGRVLRAAIWAVTGREAAGTRVSAYVGFVLAGLAAAYGLLGASGGVGAVGASYTLYILFLAAYLGTNAAAALRRAGLADRAPGLSAGRLARRALTATGDLPLAEALRRAGAAGASAVVITSSDGRPEGLVSGAAVDAVPPERRPWVPVSSVARPLAPGLVLDARLDGQAVLAALRSTPAGEYLVVDPGGAVLGVLATVDVVAAVDPKRRR